MNDFASLPATSGLKALQALIRGELPAPPIGETMGIHAVQVAAGSIILEGRPDQRHLNPAGAVHGGFAATCLDGAAALALFSILEADVPHSTVDLNVKYVRPLRPGEKIKCPSSSLTATTRALDRFDRLGAVLSSLCAIHCLCMPLLLGAGATIGPAMVFGFLSAETIAAEIGSNRRCIVSPVPVPVVAGLLLRSVMRVSPSMVWAMPWCVSVGGRCRECGAIDVVGEVRMARPGTGSRERSASSETATTPSVSQ